MLDLAPDERTTLELIDTPSPEAVFDGSTLIGLHDKGLVEMSIEGWTVTPLGRLMLHAAKIAA